MSLMKSLHASAALLTLATIPALADDLPTPTNSVILTISGAVDNETADGLVTLDLDLLKSMDTKVFTTATIWLEDEVEFTGVSLRDLLDYAGATGASFDAVALNDYKVNIPADAIAKDAPIVAYLMDGEEMPPRGKGPLWVVYPYDADAKYRTEVTYSRSIWQLDRIVSVK
jgi:hypothetical protein